MHHVTRCCLTAACIVISPLFLSAQSFSYSSRQSNFAVVPANVRVAIDDFSADQIDRYIRGVNAAKALRDRTASAKEAKEQAAGMSAGMSLASLSPAQMDKLTAQMECRQGVMGSTPEALELMMKEGNTSLPTEQRKAAASRLTAIYTKKCGPPPKGWDVMNPPLSETKEEERPDYHAVAVAESGLSDRDFARMSEIVAAYLAILEDGANTGELRRLFNATELGVLKARTAKLKIAYEIENGLT